MRELIERLEAISEAKTSEFAHITNPAKRRRLEQQAAMKAKKGGTEKKEPQSLDSPDSYSWYQLPDTAGGYWYAVIAKLKGGNERVIKYSYQNPRAVTDSYSSGDTRGAKSVKWRDIPADVRKALERKMSTVKA